VNESDVIRGPDGKLAYERGYLFVAKKKVPVLLLLLTDHLVVFPRRLTLSFFC